MTLTANVDVYNFSDCMLFFCAIFALLNLDSVSDPDTRPVKVITSWLVLSEINRNSSS